MEIIEKQAAMDCCFKPQVRPNEEIFNALKMAIRSEISALPSIDAVPLDKLCEWLAVHSVNIPCETCRHFSNDYCTAIGDMDKPCPNKAEDWQMAIKEWMEGLDAEKET